MRSKAFIALCVVACALSNPFMAMALEPIAAGSASIVDVPAGSADKLSFTLHKGRFAEQSVDMMTVTANGINFKQGQLQGLSADMTNAQMDTLTLDALQLNTGAFVFDPIQLMTHRRFLLNQPVQGRVHIKLSEAHLNDYFASPRTLEKLEKAANKKLGNLGLLRFSKPAITLLGKNRLKAILYVALGGAIATPVELQGLLSTQTGNVLLTDVTLSSNGSPLPFDLAGVFTQKFNEAIDLERLGKKTFVVRVDKLATLGKTLDLNGNVQVTRLEFGGNSHN